MLSTLNAYCSGYVAVPLLSACKEGGLLDLLKGGGLSSAELASAVSGNHGYLSIALHALESLGHASRDESGRYMQQPGRDVIVPDALLLLYHEEFDALFESSSAKLLRALEALAAYPTADRDKFLLEGAVLLPLLIGLRQRCVEVTDDFLRGIAPELQAAIWTCFGERGWVNEQPRSLTELGQQMLERAHVMGIAASYRPLLAGLPDLLWGDVAKVFSDVGGGRESHVDRRLNVVSSGFQHRAYFRDAERLILSVFNQVPLSAQPAYVADMGCGDGTFLREIYAAVRDKSLRGRHLAEFPLTLIGVDYSPIALEQTALTLSGLPHLTLSGDINDPHQLVTDLASRGVEDTSRVLHVRSFLDHNFRYDAVEDPRHAVIEPGGVYVDGDGALVTGPRLLSAVSRHLRKWADVIGAHGLILLEAHCAAPRVVREHIATSESFYFDTLHALSKQYLVEAEAFLVTAANVGLFAKAPPTSYPKLLPFRRVTLSHFERRDYAVRHATSDDLDALEELECRCWAAGLRAARGALLDRIERYPAGQFVLESNGRIAAAIYSQRLERAECLLEATAATAFASHRADGAVVQLISVSVLPEFQERNFGDQLLEFMLQRCSVMAGVSSVVGITRCRDYDRSRGQSLEDYVRSRDEHGALCDPILRFHEAHGAVVGELLRGYRPEDVDNEGAGVWVRYDVHGRQRRAESAAAAAFADTAAERERDLRRIIARCVGADAEATYASDVPLMEMGLNSGDLLGLGDHLRRKYGLSVPPTFFFEHRTPKQILGYLSTQLRAATEPVVSAAASREGEGEAEREDGEAKPRVARAVIGTARAGAAEPIAIIGMACRLPGGVESPAELWSLLSAKRSTVGRLPSSRWRWPSAIDPSHAHAGIGYGAYFDDLTRFDASFFRISPREAELLDPQQRLLLELSWHVLEDAGYSRRMLSGSDTGVFIGASGSDYARLLDAAGVAADAHYGTGNAASVLANRISYFFDWHGPSMTIDTACSSSLVALHQAMQALRAGEASAALVGGINVVCHPANSIAYYEAGMLAKDGRCKTFDSRADGYVRGEGAVMLLLKPLADAVRDGDRIHAMLVGSSVNHGGLASGLTVPNPERQASLYRAAWRAAGISPADLGYIEAHGTGTALGDPIELRGLKQAFGAPGVGRCALGSIKTNIGHLEAAAGLAGVVKSVLCLQRREVPASLHFEALNPHIDLSDSPFFIAADHQAWPNGAGPARAAVSSFGSGGANAHVVLEGYAAARRPVAAGPEVVVLSARTESCLKAWIQRFHEHLASDAGKATSLASIAYTLQRREPMAARAAIVVSSVGELKEALASLLEGRPAPAGCYRGKPGSERGFEDAFLEQEDVSALVNTWLAAGRLDKLARLWVSGTDVDWAGLRRGYSPAIADLPGYAFSKDSYWLPASTSVALPAKATRVHPLLQQNVSDLSQQRFASRFAGDEFFFVDHVVKGLPILPGVAHLEMARAALVESHPGVKRTLGWRLTDVVWARPVVLGASGCTVNVSLCPETDGRLRFDIFEQPEAEGEAALTFSHGYAERCPPDRERSLDVAAVKARCSRGEYAHERCYQAFAEMGIDYGPRHRGIELVHQGEREMLALLRLPAQLEPERETFVLHPALLDAALQVPLLMTGGALPDYGGTRTTAPRLTIPYDVAMVDVLGACTSTMWAWVRFSEGSGPQSKVLRYDVTLCNESGEICAELRSFSSRSYGEQASTKQLAAVLPPRSAAQDSGDAVIPTGPLLLTPVWRSHHGPDAQAMSPAGDERTLILGGTREQIAIVSRAYPNSAHHELSASASSTVSGCFGVDTPVEHIVWIAPTCAVTSSSDPVLIDGQSMNVLLLFKTIKQLLSLGYERKQLTWTIVTTQALASHPEQAVNPVHAALHGLAGALAKEQPGWGVRLIDCEQGDDFSTDLFSVAPDPQGRAWLRRSGRWLTQWLIPTSLREGRSPSVYRDGGVYVVIGGAGTVGEAWTREMIAQHRARVIWIGRRPLDAAIDAKLASCSRYGIAPSYVAADARNEDELRAAYASIKAEHGAIHGVVHAAMSLFDAAIADLDEADFADVLSAKVQVCVRIAQVFAGDALDFALFFSSMVSLIKNAKQSHYAAGCAFKDGFALLLSREWKCPVKVVNWGYWENSADVAASDVYRKLAEVGIGRIDAKQGMQAIDAAFSSPTPQLGFMVTAKPLPIEAMSLTEEIKVLQAQSLPTPSDVDLAGHAVEPRALSGGVKATPELDHAMTRVLWATLQQFGLFEQEQCAKREIDARFALRGFYRDWLRESLSMLASAGYLQEDGDIFWVADPRPTTLTSAWAEWESQASARREDASQRAQLALAEACLRGLPGILRGDELATDVLFPNGALDLVAPIYAGGSAPDFFNEVLVGAARGYVDARMRRDASAKLRILEIGAGTGGTAKVLLERLRPYASSIEEYCFTDVSKAFLLRAEQTLKPRHPYLTTHVFDVEREPSASLGRGYDLVVATNVLHATRSVRETLRNAKVLLKRGGWLLLNELSEKTLFAHLTFGLLEGFWRYEDPALRIPGSPALTPRSWAAALREEGFETPRFLAEQAHAAGQQIILAVSNGVVSETRARPTVAPERQPSLRPVPRPNAGASERQRPLRPVSPPMSAVPERVTRSAPVEMSDRDPTGATRGDALPDGRLREKASRYFKRVVADVLKLPLSKVQGSEPLESYGIDSILAIQITASLRKVFGSVSSTLLFEVGSVDALTDHFLSTQKETVARLVGFEEQARREDDDEAAGAKRAAEMPHAVEAWESSARHRFRAPPPPQAQASERDDVAVVGLAGRYAQADDIESFWQNLKAGRSCISEIPRERWDWRQFFDERRGEEGVIYTKWGGFLTDIDKFDPLFFQISPKEAELMDPQERLFLETAYACLQDSGYTPASLSASRRVGVFVGVMNATYPVKPNYFSIANRVSFLFDLRGPSMAVDTACSSSATALHLALESVRSGECELAIAGGVNLVVSPQHYVNLCRLTMLSSTSECKAFGEHADGFVDGEGVGAVLLKPLSRAIADGDNIYGVIKGSAINAAGRTNGYTVPSPTAQGALVQEALRRASVDARTVSYVEAHGTGTILGDPIEVAGLTRAFAEHTSDPQFCALGSAKSNIGHCESAAGIAGLTKLLLQLRHRMLVPSLHSTSLNPNIDFGRTPFFVQHQLSDWRRPVVSVNGVERECLRTAGLSSFGAGGSNAHLVVQEVDEADLPARGAPVERRHLVPLSARTEAGLRESARRLLLWIRDSDRSAQLQLRDVAFTLQVGREAMAERACVLADSLPDLESKLATFLDGAFDEDVLRGSVNDDGKALTAFSGDRELRGAIEGWIAKGKLLRVAELWIKGVDMELGTLFYEGEQPRRVSLPTYPFARNSYWVSRTDSVAAGGAPPEKRLPASVDTGCPLENVARPDTTEAATASKKWLFAREMWVDETVSDGEGLSRGLERCAGQHVCIVYAERAGLDALHLLLGQVQAAVGLRPGLEVTHLHVDSIADARFDPTPSVVLFLGPLQGADETMEASLAHVARVFELSKTLMRRAWDRPVELYYLYEMHQGAGGAAREALSGLLRSAMLENHLHSWTMVGVEAGEASGQIHRYVLREWLGRVRATDSSPFRHVHYTAGVRRVWRLVESEPVAPTAPLFRAGGTYLLAGGLGPVGALLCRELAVKYRPTLVIFSRGPRDAAKAEQCATLEALGARVHYFSVDITDPVALAGAHAAVKAMGLELEGVIHLARLVEDALIASKSWEAFARVVAAKVAGTVNLDRVTSSEPLQFFLLFSSIAAFGLRGGADYAYSAAFQNAFARHRNVLWRQGDRSGRAFAQAWGAWRVDRYQPQNRDVKFTAAGFDFIEERDALPAIEAGWRTEEASLATLAVAKPDEARRALGLPGSEPAADAGVAALMAGLAEWEAEQARGVDVSTAVTAALDERLLSTLDATLVDRLYRLMFPLRDERGPATVPHAEPSSSGAPRGDLPRLVSETLAAVLKLKEVDPNQSFQSYGLDSISAMQLATRLERSLEIDLPPQWLIDFSSVRSLSQRLSDEIGRTSMKMKGLPALKGQAT